MAKQVDINVTDEDIEYTRVIWYPDRQLFIRQKEKSVNSMSHLLMFNEDEARQLRDILNQYLEDKE